MPHLSAVLLHPLSMHTCMDAHVYRVTYIQACIHAYSSLKWLYSKQPKLGLTQEFVVDCAHALCVVYSTKRLVSLMLLKWFLSDSFIYFMYRMLNETF